MRGLCTELYVRVVCVTIRNPTSPFSWTHSDLGEPQHWDSYIRWAHCCMNATLSAAACYLLGGSEWQVMKALALQAKCSAIPAATTACHALEVFKPILSLDSESPSTNQHLAHEKFTTLNLGESLQTQAGKQHCFVSPSPRRE